jgi:protein-L-isoaspartate(D-aspartate) O-methyltransferase
MTDQRAKRFPLALADLVREPRKPLARPDAAKPKGASKATSKPVLKSVGGGAKDATGKTGTVKLVKPSSVAEGRALASSKTRLHAAGSAAPSTAARPVSLSARNQSGALRSAARQGETSTVAIGGSSSGLKSHAVAQPAAARKPGEHALTSERVRERMVERLRANGITDQRVLAAMLAVPRHQFVDPGLAAQAYEDAALPIGHHQTISKPSVVARMIELVAAGRTLTSVLEIGTGCGYQAAVLSQIATDVYSIERVRPLSERAKLNLRPLRVPNIRLHYGDGRLGLPAAAPFDAIVIACAGLDVPQALLEQLAIGGRLVAPVGSQTAQAQILTLVERVSATQWRESQLDRVFFVPLKSGVI